MKGFRLLALLALGAGAVHAQDDPALLTHPRGHYEAGNAFEGLELTGATATYDPFGHAPGDGTATCASRITLTFEVTNRGAAPARTPSHLHYEVNAVRPWRERPSSAPPLMLDFTNTPPGERARWTYAAGSVEIEARTVAPGEAFEVTTTLLPPEGAWNPLRVEARLGRMGMDEDFNQELIYLGRESPGEWTLSTDAPDFTVLNARFRGKDGLPLEQAALFDVGVWVGVAGPAVEGPMRVCGYVARVGCDSKPEDCPAISACDEEDTPLGFFEMNDVQRRHEADWTSGQFTVKVSCPVHGTAIRDANPANDDVRRGSTPEEPLMGGSED